MMKTFSLLFSLLCLVVFCIPVKADIYRGCTGIFSLYIAEGYKSDYRNKQIDIFEGRGACKNKLEANTCRIRAKDNIFRCATDLWNRRWNLIGNPKDEHADLGLPDSCLGRATGAKDLGPFRENPFGQYFDIKYHMEYTACCEMQPNTEDLRLSLTVHSGGDKGCGKDRSPYGGYREHRVLEDNYKVNCKNAIAHGMCAKRTGG